MYNLVWIHTFTCLGLLEKVEVIVQAMGIYKFSVTSATQTMQKDSKMSIKRCWLISKKPWSCRWMLQSKFLNLVKKSIGLLSINRDLVKLR